MIDLDVITGPGEWSQVADVEALARRAIDAATTVAMATAAPMELSLLLTDDAGIRELNRTWRNFDKPTNVLSFPGGGSPSPEGIHHVGDIAVAFETVAREAEAEGKSLADHLTHLIVHGTLHLLGYDHEKDEEAEGMEALETKALAGLGIADPYRDMAA